MKVDLVYEQSTCDLCSKPIFEMITAPTDQIPGIGPKPHFRCREHSQDAEWKSQAGRMRIENGEMKILLPEE